jgi:hypothetical protein
LKITTPVLPTNLGGLAFPMLSFEFETFFSSVNAKEKQNWDINVIFENKIIIRVRLSKSATRLPTLVVDLLDEVI